MRTLLRVAVALIVLLGAVAFLYGLAELVVAAQKWGLPEAGLVLFGAVVEGLLAFAYGGLLIGFATAGLRSRPRVGALWLCGGGGLATAVGLYLRSWSELAALMNLTVGAAALVVAALVLLFARGGEPQDRA